MFSLVFNFLIIVLVFSVLIIVHELGHFVAARLSGVRVTEFSIGFGTPIFKKKIKETVFLVCFVPLGGYIKMAGDSRSESRGYKDEFFAKAAGIRARIVFAGPAFNYVLAFLFFVVIATLGFYVQDTQVGTVKSSSPAALAGIRTGDRILAINNREVETWPQLQEKIQQSKEEVEINLEREGRVKKLIVTVEEKEVRDRLGRKIKASYVGISPYEPVVGEVISGYPAEEAGIQEGDRILEINQEKIEGWQDITEKISKAQESVFLTIERGQEVFSLEVSVKRKSGGGLGAEVEDVSVIGINPSGRQKMLKTPFPASLLKGTEMLLDTTFLSLKGLWYMLVDPAISFKDSVAGPIYISYIITKTAEVGLVPLMHLVALLSIFLFVVNLLPVPIFDGGHILFFGIEKLRKKPLSQKTEDIVTKIGFALIIALIFFVFYNDIVRRGPDIWEEVKSSFSQKNGKGQNNLEIRNE